MIGTPEAASLHAADIDQMIATIHWFMLALFVVWGVFFTYCVIRFRASKNPRANYLGVQSHYSSYLEAGVVVFEVFLLVGFAYPLWGKWVKEFPSRRDAVEIRVVAEQFAWNFHYPGADGQFGKTKVDLVDIETNPLGLDREDPYSKDDITTLNQLNLPVNKAVLIHLSSKDVIHSFKVPTMRVTQDAVPGLTIPISFTPTKTGTFDIACAQLCGIGHYRMKGYLNVKTPQEFKAWMEEQAAEKAQQSGADEVWG